MGGPYGPYIQSQRLDIYHHYAQELIRKGGAHYCFCSDEIKEQDPCIHLSDEEIQQKIQNGTPYVIRQTIPQTGITSFDDEASSLRSLMRDNATQKERTVQDKCREVKLYLEKVIPVIRDLPENKGIPTKQLIANDLGMSATAVQQLMSIIKNDDRVTEMFLNKKINLQGAYMIATSDFKDEVIETVEKKATLTAEISSNFIKKTINELEKNDKTNKKTEIKEINDNHIILLKDNLLAITHCKGNDPLKTEFNMYSGSKLIIECFYKLGRIKISWQSNNESYYKTVNIASYIDIETAVVVLMKISCATYTYIINEIITDCYLRNESKYKDIDNMADNA